jgi:cation diffusion facilitator CzcD-associated flavoprotein CzcO
LLIGLKSRPAVFYSFSFAPNPRWTTFYPPGSEIYAYLEEVCNKYGITDKIQLDTDVTECRWLEEEELWEVTIKHLLPGIGDLSQKDRTKLLQEHGESRAYSCTEKIRTKVVLSCVGGLVDPKGWPEDIPGIKDFKGAMFHSARWDHSVDFNNKDVIVVGTGCSSTQLVPHLITSPFNAKSVTQLMRSPPWVVNPRTPPGGVERWKKISPSLMTYVPGLLKLTRLFTAAVSEYDFRLFGDGQWHEQERKKVERKLLRHMKSIVPEKYHEIMTPDYGVGCKRRVLDSMWLSALNDSKIDLTTLPLTSVQEHSVTLGPGRLYPDPRKPSNVPTEQKTVPADIIVLANGYEVQNWLHPLKVIGKQGKDLINTMMERGGPQAYQGTAMDGFPNFFIIFGPNTVTGHSSVIMASENMADYAMRFIKPLLKKDARTVEVKMEAEQEYTRDIQKSLSKTVWMSGGCQSWYFTKDGWNSTVLPYV